MMMKYYENEQVQDTLHIYTRVSGGVRDVEQSLDLQRQLGIKEAKTLGVKYKIWNEGFKKDQKSNGHNVGARPVLRKLLHAVDKGSVKHLYLTSSCIFRDGDKPPFGHIEPGLYPEDLSEKPTTQYLRSLMGDVVVRTTDGYNDLDMIYLHGELMGRNPERSGSAVGGAV